MYNITFTVLADYPTGVLSTLDADAVASDIMSGKYAYVDGEKITGSYVPENLDSVITAQEQKLEALETILENKTNSGGDGSSLNIFCQLDEPEVKKGIWLQAEREIEHITVDEEIYVAGTWADTDSKGVAPNNVYGAARCGNYIYLFNSNDSGNSSSKYDIVNNTYSAITNPPIFPSDGAVTVGTDIYILNIQTLYKYDTLTDTYTQMPNVPYNSYQCSMVASGTDLYIIGGGNNGSRNLYKFDTITNIYTQLSSMIESIYYFYQGAATIVDNEIHIFGGWNTKNLHAKYDILTDTWTKLSNMPYNFGSGRCLSVGNTIYLFGGVESYTAKNYFKKYNVLTNTYTTLSSMPGAYNSGYGSPIYTGTELRFYFGITSFYVYNLTSKTYNTNTLILLQGKYKSLGYEIELYSNTKNIVAPIYPFADAYFYSNQIETNIPTYYGNGTDWIKFKN